MAFLLTTLGSGAGALLRALDRIRDVHVVPVPSHLFAQGLARILEHRSLDDGYNGLDHLAAADDVLLSTRLLGDSLLGAPDGAPRVIEYSPEHIAITGPMLELYPDAALIHLVRDGREVVMRLSSPRDGMAARFAAQRWLEDQQTMLGLAALPGYCCVRWEDLLADPRAVLLGLVGHLGLAVSADELAAAAATLPSSAPPPRFAGRAPAIVDLVGGDLLVRYGYARRRVPRSEQLAAWAELARAAVWRRS